MTTLSNVRKYLETAMYLELQPSRLSPVSSFASSSAVWYLADDFSEEIEDSEFQGNHGEIFDHEGPAEPISEGPRETARLVVTPTIFTTIVRSIAGNFSGGVVQWATGIPNYVSLYYREAAPGGAGQLWRLEDAWITRARFSVGVDGDQELEAEIDVAAEKRTTQSLVGATITAPAHKTPPLAEKKTWKHRAARFYRDPSGSNDEFLPARMSVEIDQAYMLFYNGERIEGTRALPRIVKKCRTTITIELETEQYSDEYEVLREDAIARTKLPGRLALVDGPRTITFDLPVIKWETPRRRAGGGRVGPFRILGRAYTDGTTEALRISKSGF